MSYINAITSPSPAVITYADATGNLQLQTAGTTALNLDANQNATFTGSVGSTNTFAFKNRVINGRMEIDQRNSGAAQTGVYSNAYYYLADRFRIGGNATGAARFTFQQVTDAPNGFLKSGKITVTTNQASFAAGDLSVLSHLIEGYNISDLAWGTVNAAPVTLSFWIKCSVAGTYSVSVNSSSSSGYLTNYTVNTPNTWEYKTIVVPAATTGTWGADSSLGIRIDWNLGSGSTSTSSGGAWQNTLYYSVTGSTQLAGTSNATWQITGVQLEKGSVATTFDQRSYTQEMALCQRYFWRALGSVAWQGNWYNGGGTIRIGFKHPVSMRVAPSITRNGTVAFYSYAVTDASQISYNSVANDTEHSSVVFTTTGAGSSAAGVGGYTYSSGSVDFSSEY